jgi:hypothetical protein
VATAGSIVTTLTNDSRGFKRGMDSARKDLSGFQSAISTAKTAVAGFFAFSAIKAGVTSFAGMIKESITRIDDLGAAATKIGVGTEFLSELQFAAALSDTSIEDLNKGLTQMALIIGKGGGSGSPEEAFMRLVDEIAAIEDPMQRAKAAADAFGAKLGRNLLPLLIKGRKGIEELRAEARRLGGSVSEDMQAKFGLADDALKRLDASFSVLANKLASEFVPLIVDMTPKLIDFAAALSSSVVPAITETKNWVDDLVNSMSEMIFIGGKLAEGKGIRDAFKDLKEVSDFDRKAAGMRRKAVEEDIAKRIAERVAKRPESGGGATPFRRSGGGGTFDIGRGKDFFTDLKAANAPLAVASREGFDLIARAMTPAATNGPAQQLAETKKTNAILNKVAAGLAGISLPNVAPDF